MHVEANILSFSKKMLFGKYLIFRERNTSNAAVEVFSFTLCMSFTSYGCRKILIKASCTGLPGLIQLMLFNISVVYGACAHLV